MPGAQGESEALTVGDAFIHTLRELEVDHVFASLGSDHAQLIESFAKFKALGWEAPRLMVFPHESLAMSAAHGYAQATGRPQAVLVHAVTLHGEKKGSRDTFIHFLQDTFNRRPAPRDLTVTPVRASVRSSISKGL